MAKETGQCPCGSYSFYKEEVVFYATSGAIVESSTLTRLICVKCGAGRVVETGIKDGKPYKNEYSGPDAVNRVRSEEKEYRTLEISDDED